MQLHTEIVPEEEVTLCLVEEEGQGLGKDIFKKLYVVVKSLPSMLKNFFLADL